MFMVVSNFLCFQASSKKVITREEWEKKLDEVNIRKEDMNKLVMNFLVTEGYVDAAEKFQMESGTERIPFLYLMLCYFSGCLILVFRQHLFIFNCKAHPY